MRSFLVFVDELYEDLELWVPKIRLQEAGFFVTTAGPEAGKTYFSKHGYPCKADLSYAEVEAQSLEGVVIPGGYAPDKIRRYSQALQIVRQLFEEGKTIAFICHGGWVPISAKILKGKQVTGAAAIRDDLENAGAEFLDKPVVVDGNLISSRSPLDLPFFCQAILKNTSIL